MNTLRSSLGLLFPPLATLFAFSLLLAPGCGSSRKAQEQELINQNLRMQFKADSLAAETNRLMNQLDALAAENRALSARAGELETKLRESQAAPPPPPPIADMSSAYANALSQYRTRDFSGAMTQFERLLHDGIREDLADNCHYWIGECLYGLGRYSDALHHFDTVLGYASSDKKDDSIILIGNSQAMLGNKSSAAESYNKLISSYPASPYVKKAQEKLAKLGM